MSAEIDRDEGKREEGGKRARSGHLSRESRRAEPGSCGLAPCASGVADGEREREREEPWWRHGARGEMRSGRSGMDTGAFGARVQRRGRRVCARGHRTEMCVCEKAAEVSSCSVRGARLVGGAA